MMIKLQTKNIYIYISIDHDIIRFLSRVKAKLHEMKRPVRAGSFVVRTAPQCE